MADSSNQSTNSTSTNSTDTSNEIDPNKLIGISKIYSLK